MIRLLILSLAALLFLADPAAADPISGLIAAGKAFFATKLGAIVAQVAISSGLSLIAQRLRKKPKQPGLQNQFKGRGGTEPGSFVLGRAAINGATDQGGSACWAASDSASASGGSAAPGPTEPVRIYPTLLSGACGLSGWDLKYFSSVFLLRGFCSTQFIPACVISRTISGST